MPVEINNSGIMRIEAPCGQVYGIEVNGKNVCPEGFGLFAFRLEIDDDHRVVITTNLYPPRGGKSALLARSTLANADGQAGLRQALSHVAEDAEGRSERQKNSEFATVSV